MAQADGSLTAPIGAGITTAPIAAPDPSKSTPDLTRLRTMFDDSRETNTDARTEAVRDREYYDGLQLTAEQKAILRARGQPTVEFNRIVGGVNGILGVIEQGKTDPRAYMRNPPEDKPPPQAQGQPMPGQQPQQQPAPKKRDAGDVASMTIRYGADINDFDAIKIDVSENICIEGCGAAIFEVDQANGNEVLISQIPWDEFFYDPRSRRKDFADARYMGVGKWMYADILAGIYPSKAKEIENCAVGSGSPLSPFDSTWEDKPENASPWIDSKQKRLMVVEMYYIESGGWHRCVFYAGDVLESAPSPYKDDRGQTICPIVADTAYIDGQRRRYGVVRMMRGPQDEINMRRIKAVHEINTRQVQQVDPLGPPIDMDIARAEAARPDGVLPVNTQIVQRQDVVANNIVMLQHATAEIERFGPSPAILGRQSADASGRAQQIRQQAGLTELMPVLGRVLRWEKRCFKMIWNIQRQFWDAPKWIRTTDDMGTPDYIQINEPEFAEVPQMDPATGQMMMTRQVVGMKNHIAKMDVDIVIDTVPDTATLQQEQFADVIQLVPIYGPQEFPLEIVLEMSSIPKRRELIERLKQLRAEAAQAMMQNPMAQLEHAEKRTGVLKTASEIEKNRAQTKKLDVEATTEAMHGVADARGYESGMPPPGTPKGALDGTEPP